ncbi:MAG: enoyl-CoA hydratase/isomerase family protein [Rhodospirillaceae bacterium]|jgi:enoyl-CoA hydratase|nr:enoyl-CoA hydratase/isomerase family protein [Rhodospirillaceae bacterium]
MSDKDVVLVEREGAVATVILNRPEKLNALTKEMWGRVGEVFRELDQDEDLRCIIFRGAGDEAVGPGADISEFATERNNSEQAADYGALMHNSMRAIRDCRHPVIARIRGLCVGGAMELALMCDMRICGEGSKFGVPINRLGLVMAYPEVEALVSLVGPSVALEILYEARVFGAEEAKEKGLVNRVVADEEVDTAVAKTVEKICAGAPLVNRWHKKFVYKVVQGVRPPQLLSQQEEAEGFACFDTEDYQEGVRAFLAKDTPKFKGK